MQRTILVSLAVTAMLIQLGMAANHDVGDSSGWDTSSDISTWASSRTFRVGDNVVFKYTPMHNVVEVSKSDYDTCQATTVIQAFSDGNTVIALKAPGKRYFICGTPGHCGQGMKLEVNALSTPTATSPASPPRKAGSPASPPPSGGASPSPAKAAAPTASSPAVSSDAPSSSDGGPSAASPIAPSTETRAAAPAPSAAPARGGLALGMFGAIVMVLAF